MRLSFCNFPKLKRLAKAMVVCQACALLCAFIAEAQDASMQKMLDQVSGSFPPSQAVPGQPAYSQTTMPSPVTQPNLPQAPANLFANVSPLQRLLGNGNAAAAPAANPRMNLLKIFFGDGSGSSGNSAEQAGKYQTAQDCLSTARDQEQRAENAASRASYGDDLNARKEAASEARYAAQAAREAADRASSAGYNGGPAGDAASAARAAADSAQAAADRATANASGGAW